MEAKKRFESSKQVAHIYKVNYTSNGQRLYKILKAESASQAEESLFSQNSKAKNIHAEIIDGTKEI